MNSGLCCIEGPVRMWVSLPERAPWGGFSEFLKQSRKAASNFCTSLRTDLWFLFRLKSLAHVVASLCCGNLSSWPPGIDSKCPVKDANGKAM